MRSLILIAHNVRSTHNVGALLRTAEGLGVEKVFLTGYTPYPKHSNDDRLPHLAAKIDHQIHKTALGAESLVPWQHKSDIETVMIGLKQQGYQIAAIEQADNSTSLPNFHSPQKLAIIAGREVEGIEPEVLAACDIVLEIPMIGNKESFNVVQAAAMVLYHCRFTSSN